MPKTIRLIRHAQSTFNAVHELTGVDPLHFDAPLSPLGRRQVAAARDALPAFDHELIVVSPFTRAIETAIGLFGAAASMRVEALARERLANSCDVGRSPRLLAQDFPALAFDHLDDPWWHDGPRDERDIAVEPDDVFAERVERFRGWLAARPERAITVVAHGGLLFTLTGRPFANCEAYTWEL